MTNFATSFDPALPVHQQASSPTGQFSSRPVLQQAGAPFRRPPWIWQSCPINCELIRDEGRVVRAGLLQGGEGLPVYDAKALTSRST